MKTTLCVVTFVLAATFAVGLGADADKNAKDGKIRQCTCDEMDACWKAMHEEMKPCVDKCKEGLTAPGLDKEAAQKCMEQRQDKSKCHKAMQAKMCATSPDTFIAMNETWQGRRLMRKDIENSIEHEDTGSDGHLAGGWRHHHGGHRRHGFISFIRANFGDSGKDFGKCMKKCFRARKDHSCIKNLGCGVRKLSKAEWKDSRSACSGHFEERKKTMCECLGNAGLKKVVCEFGKKKGDKKDDQ